LELSIRNLIRELFAGFDHDLNDWIMEIEKEINRKQKLFTIYQRLHHDFYVQKDHSFAVLILLNYMKMFKLTPEIAFAEVVNLSLEKTYCVHCGSIDDGLAA
jgi:hypothetical protein